MIQDLLAGGSAVGTQSACAVADIKLEDWDGEDRALCRSQMQSRFSLGLFSLQHLLQLSAMRWLRVLGCSDVGRWAEVALGVP